MTRWERLNADSTDWQRRLELALDRLVELQEAEDLLDGQLRQAEMVKEAWEPVGDLSIDSLQENIDKVKVRLMGRFFCYLILVLKWWFRLVFALVLSSFL